MSLSPSLLHHKAQSKTEEPISKRYRHGSELINESGSMSDNIWASTKTAVEKKASKQAMSSENAAVPGSDQDGKVATIGPRNHSEMVVSKSGDYEEIKVTTGSSEITIRSKQQKAIAPSPSPSETTQLTNESDETYDPEDWTDFLQYQRTDKRGSLEFIEKSEFYEALVDRPGSFSAIRLYRSKLGSVEIHLISGFLRELLQTYVSAQEFEGVKVKPTVIEICSPFIVLYHYLDKMKSAVQLDTRASIRDKASFSALEKLCGTQLIANAWETANHGIEHGSIAYADLWALYKPHDKVVVQTSEKDGRPSIMKLNSVRNPWTRDFARGGPAEFAWTVTALCTTWDGRAFRETLQTKTIPTFSGRKRITELKIIPLHLHPAREIIQQEAESCGYLWARLCNGEPRTMMYDGLGTPLLVERSLGNRRPVIPEQQNVKSRVIVDPRGNFKAATSANLNRGLEFYTEDESDKPHTKYRQESLDEPDLTLCPPRMAVFSFEDQEWFIVNVIELKEIAWDSKLMEKLELPMEEKRLLRALVQAHSSKDARRSGDMVQGKGKGLIFLFHGPSGVGKTLTAESLSEITQKPLYKVNLGVISSIGNWELHLDHIFNCAHSWNSILLIDEADVVLEERTVSGRSQNAWASVFLRKLEYYEGILILTTNLVNTIDEAFRSRITIAIEFKELSYTARRKIWTTFINSVDRTLVDHAKILNEATEWANVSLNARQIRNIVLTAESLALTKGEGGKIEPDDIQIVLNHTMQVELRKIVDSGKEERLIGRGW